jgi:IclR family acetate operon transcriptional repressor
MAPVDARSVGDEPARSPVQSVDRALLLLREFERRTSITVTEASEALRTSKSTAHRLLAVLQLHGLVRQDPRSKAYVRGPTLIRIGVAVTAGFSVLGAAQPSLKDLVASTGETAHLVVLQDFDVLFLAGYETTHGLRRALQIGITMPAHTTASGKAILATMPEDEVRRLWARGSPMRPSRGSSSKWQQLAAELDAIRGRGWASNDEETEPGLRAVAASIPDGRGQSSERAALVVAGPLERMSLVRLPAIASVVVAQAELVAQRLRPSD